MKITKKKKIQEMFENLKPLVLNSSNVNIWFTSDLHFGHRNILKFCARPWKSIEEMNEGLIKNWNSVVGKDDIIFNLGDFAFAPDRKWKEILKRLNGHHYLILGNHDITRWPGDKIMELFEGVSHQMILKIDGRTVYLNHYPYLCFGGAWRKPENAVYQLFGHVHSGPNCGGTDTNRLVNLFPYQYDVGVDNNDYFPIAWTQVKEIISRQVTEGISIPNEEHTIPDKAYKE